MGAGLRVVAVSRYVNAVIECDKDDLWRELVMDAVECRLLAPDVRRDMLGDGGARRDEDMETAFECDGCEGA